MTVKYCVWAAAAALLSGATAAAEMELAWTMPDGSVKTERRPLADADGAVRFVLPRAEIAARGAVRLALTPDFATARKGEDGFWVVPTGELGRFREDEGRFVCAIPTMSLYGMKTPRRTFAAIVTGLRNGFKVEVEAKAAVYRMSCVLDGALCVQPHEDFSVEFHTLEGEDSNYGGMARAYRRHQLARGAVRPLSVRAAENPVLKYAVEAPEIRIRQAWKPVPSPVPEQVPENEPQLKTVVTFARVADIVHELKRQGVGKAELCLVGWNLGGHDGRWPQAFPVEPALGGEDGLRACIREARDAGYLIVPHGNFRDAYRIAENWDIEYLIKDAQGEPVQSHPVFWGGGRQFQICPRRAWEFWSTREMPRMAALGFKGLGYFDVVTILPAPVCDDPRHPLNADESAAWWGKSAREARKFFGGFASEGSIDHFAGELDSVLYASFGDPRAARKGLVDRIVPIWQMAYNGIIVNNPFTTTVNATVQDRHSLLKLMEFGGRPNFYFYSRFVNDGTDWMGDSDLRCATNEELAKSVAAIRAGWNIYSRVSRLQFLFIDRHEELAQDVFLTGWSDGTTLVTNYGAAPFAHAGRTVPPADWALFEP